KETIPGTVAFVRAFNQAGNIGNHERAKVTRVDYPQMRLQSCERIVGDLRSRGRDGRNKRRLAGVRKADQTNVGQQLQFKLQFEFFAGTAFLMITRSAIRRGREMCITKTAATALRRQP